MSEEISVVQDGDSIDISEAERELIPSEGYVVDHITGEKLVKDTPKEQVRQFIAKALEQEYNISRKICKLTLWWVVGKIVVLSTSPFFIMRENILFST